MIDEDELCSIINEEASIDADNGCPTQAGWLISYADMMTLIACFFIIMMAFANFDPKTFKKVALEISKYYRGANVLVEEDLLTMMVAKLDKIEGIEEAVTIKQDINKVEITYNSQHLFESGSAKLLDRPEALLQEIIQTIKEESTSVSIVVEGHTDDEPISSKGKIKKFFESNWELSAVRSASIARKFNLAGFPKNKISSIGFADSRPIAPNRDQNGIPIEDNRSSNRRVVIKVAQPPPEGYKMGFGIIYEMNKDLKDSSQKNKEINQD